MRKLGPRRKRRLLNLWKQVWFQLDFNFSNETNFTFLARFTTWPQMTFDLSMWPLSSLTYEGLHVASMIQVWFQLDFNFWNETNFTFLAYFPTWPQVTFDLGMWPLSSLTYEGSHVASMIQVWFQLDFNFSNETNFTFLAYFPTWPQMTFDLSMWPLSSLTYEGSHVASMIQVWFQLDFNFSMC